MHAAIHVHEHEPLPHVLELPHLFDVPHVLELPDPLELPPMLMGVIAIPAHGHGLELLPHLVGRCELMA